MLQTLQANVAVGEQLFVLKENGQYLPLTPTPGVPGGGAGPAPIAGVDDGGVAEAGLGPAAGTLVYVKGDATAEVLTWNGTSWVALGISPFRATFNVDPTFAGKQLGSESNPFVTVAAAFAAAAAQGLTSFLVLVPPLVTITENIVFPTAGNVEIAAQNLASPNPANFTGTITLTNTASAFYTFSGVQLSGAVSGNAAATMRVLFQNTRATSTVNLTASAGISLRAIFEGIGPGSSGVIGTVNGALTIAGSIVARGYRFLGLVSYSAGIGSVFTTCSFDVGVTTTGAGAVQGTYYSCFNNGAPLVFTASSGSMQVLLDGATAANFLQIGTTISGAVTFTTLRGNGATRQTLANNSGAIPLGGRYPSSQVTINVSLTLLAVGTLAAIQAAVTYTDMTGALVTQNIGGTLNGGAGGAIGDKLNASLSFSQNGATAITVQFTGVTTPGALSFQADASAQMVS
jgi:hypothetical protein